MKKVYTFVFIFFTIIGAVAAGLLCWNFGSFQHLLVKTFLTFSASILGAVFGLEAALSIVIIRETFRQWGEDDE